jgi:hypothetical protein
MKRSHKQCCGTAQTVEKFHAVALRLQCGAVRNLFKNFGDDSLQYL